MKYSKFIINNYKGIQGEMILDLTKLPNSNIFTLVGLNESGKTSILEAINLLQNRINNKDAHQMIHKSKKGNFNDVISIKAFLVLEDEDEKRIQEFCKSHINFILTKPIGTISICKEYIFKASQFDKYESLWTLPLIGKYSRSKIEDELYKKNRAHWAEVVSYIENNFPKILYYRNFLFDFPQNIYLESIETDSQEIAEYRKMFQDILDSFNDNLTIEKHILERLKNPTNENKEALDSLLGQISQKLTNVIFGSWDKLFTKGNKEIELKIDQDVEKKYYIDIKIKQGRDRFNINERSLGFRWFFSFLLFTEFRKERKEDFGETLFLLDEPASNLHQKSQQKLLDLFEKLSNNSKIIYATHSQHLINPKYLAGTYIIKNAAINYDNIDNFSTNETSISATLYKNFASKYPDETDHFKPILDSIDYAPSSFELVENIICLEGKNDYYTYMFMKNLYTSKKYKNLHFYPGASVSKFEQLFRLYIAWNKKFIALFDSDKAGITHKAKYIKEISIELNSNIFTLKDVKNNWVNMTTEDLFEEADKLEIINHLFPGTKDYDKSKFNTSLQDLFINKKKIELSKTSKDRFKRIFDFICSKI